MNRTFILILTLFTLAFRIFAQEKPWADWPEWRGPSQNGIVPEKDAQGAERKLPLSWNEEKKENVAWKTPIPGAGHSTPAIGGGQLWVTSATPDGLAMFVYGLNTSDGKIFFETKLFENASAEPLGNPVNNYAAPSPVLEQDRVYVHFGSYGTACLDTKDGKTLWTRRDLPCRHYRGPGSSPVLFQNLLILTMDGVDVQYMVALDKQTGKTVWKTDRNTVWTDLDEKGQPKAEGDFRKAYSTPVLVPMAGGAQLVTIASNNAFGYDALTGKELWWYPHGGFSNAARPLVSDKVLFINSGYGKANMHAVKWDAAATRGEIPKTERLWEHGKNMPNRASSVLFNDFLFSVDDGGVATCLDAKTGEERWRERLSGKFSGSPILWKNHLFCANETGETYILEASDVYKQTSVSRLAEGIFSSPAVAGNRIFLRTRGHVYALGE